MFALRFIYLGDEPLAGSGFLCKAKCCVRRPVMNADVHPRSHDDVREITPVPYRGEFYQSLNRIPSGQLSTSQQPSSQLAVIGALPGNSSERSESETGTGLAALSTN